MNNENQSDRYENKMNHLAGLLENRLTKAEKLDFLEHLLEDQEGLEVLLAKGSSLGDDLLLDRVPFQITARLELGLMGPYIRIVDSFRILPGRLAARLLEVFSSIGAGHFPKVTRDRSDFLLPASGRSFNLAFGFRDGRFGIEFVDVPKSSARVEVWLRGEPWRSFSRVNPSTRLDIPKGERTLWIHFPDCGEGLRVDLQEMEFGRNDWVSTFLASALTGNLREAGQILRDRLTEMPGVGSCLEAFLTSLGAVTKSVDCTLLPVPATRSKTVPADRRIEALRVVWRGLKEASPGSCRWPNPWESTRPASTDGSGQGDGDTFFFQSLVALAENGETPQPPRLETCENEGTRQAWACLMAWDCLLRRNPNSAAEWVEQAAIDEQDPFQIRQTQFLVNHLLQIEQEEGNDARIQTSSDGFWRAALSGVMT